MNWPLIFPPLMLVTFLSFLGLLAWHNERQIRRLEAALRTKRAHRREAESREAERDGVQTDLPLRRTGSA
jgi:cell division protein FtsB